MVLYVEALQLNIREYIKLAKAMTKVLELRGETGSEYESVMRVAEKNLRVVDGLLADGVTELSVPKKTS